jgi:dTDP-4-dehydrorhamnose reductase
MAERRILEYGNTVVCRTAMVFGNIGETDRAEFNRIKDKDALEVQSYVVDYVRNALAEGRCVKMPSDEYVNPTYVGLLSRQISRIIESDAFGILHCAGGEGVSRYTFAKTIAEFYGMNSDNVIPVNHSDLLRPVNVTLDVEATERVLGFKFGGIAQMLEKMRCESV